MEIGEAGTDSRFLIFVSFVSASVGGVKGAAGGGLGIIDRGAWYSYSVSGLVNLNFSVRYSGLCAGMDDAEFF